MLEAKVEALPTKNKDLTQQILKARATTNEKITILLRQLFKASNPFS